MARITTHPGEMLFEEFMAPLGLSARELARDLGVPHNRISELVAEKRAMSADTALRLERYFGMEARFWMNLQAAYELSQARSSTSYRSIAPRQAA
jgi:addiction module HigA family antidote